MSKQGPDNITLFEYPTVAACFAAVALLAWLLLTPPPEYGNIPSPYFCDILAAVCLV